MPTINDDVVDANDNEDATISFRGAQPLELQQQSSASAIHHRHLIASIMRGVATGNHDDQRCRQSNSKANLPPPILTSIQVFG